MLSSEQLMVSVTSQEVDPSLPPPFGYKGSPTVLLDGVDLEPSARRSWETRHG